MNDVTRVLFVCVHNSARSQMAEALLRHVGGERFIAESGGFEPKPVNPLVVAAMGELGVDISEAPSQAVFDLFRAGRRYDYVIAVCDEASGERCPIFPGFTKRLSWSFPDPELLRGSEQERLALVVQMRDEMRAKIEALIASLDEHAQGAGAT